MGVADPVPGKISGQNGALHAEHLHTDDLFRHSDDPRLDNPALVDAVHPIGVKVEIEGLALAHHGLPAAGYHAAGLGVDTPHHKVNVGAQHIPQDLVLAQHQVSVFLAGGAAAQVDHHFFQGDDAAESLVVHHSHRLAVVQLLNAAQLAGEDAAGAVGVVDLMPDDVLTVFLRLHIFPAADGQD